ncbi:MAG: glycosyltransferase [Pseudomonadota bacterium]|nr:glycosyltransferase [Pseudomonadota bacterium]
MRAPISVVMPTLNSEDELSDTLIALMEGLPLGMIREVIISDGGSKDATQRIAEDAGATFLQGDAIRGSQLRRGAEVAKGKWLLFLLPGTVLAPGWSKSVELHLKDNEPGYGRLSFVNGGFAGSLVSAWANIRSRLFGLPFGDQSLLVPASLYNQIGGHQDLNSMEDVAIARALKGRLRPLGYTAQVSAAHFKRDGWFRRGRRSLWSLLRFLVGPNRAKSGAKLQR